MTTDEIPAEVLDRISARVLEDAALRNLQRRIEEDRLRAKGFILDATATTDNTTDNTPPASEGRQG